MRVLVTQLSPFSCYFLSLRSKYFRQHPVLKHPESMIHPEYGNLRFTRIYNSYNYTLQYGFQTRSMWFPLIQQYI